MEYLFTVFHRLNSGGSKLNNQEIRNCIYSGSLNQLLRTLDTNPAWRKFNSMTPGNNYRFVKQEVILRFFAFFEEPEKYNGQVGKFLNEYMHPRRHMNAADINAKTSIFDRVLTLIDRIFPDGPQGKVPTAVVEALMVGLARNIDNAESLDQAELQQRYSALRQADPFNEEGLAEGLSKKDKVESRLLEATNIFAQ